MVGLKIPRRKEEEDPKVKKTKIKMSLLIKKQGKENVTKTIRQRAEDAAYELDEDSEMCLICFLNFTDQIKQDKDITRCPTCSLLVHDACLRKSGCITPHCSI